MIYLLALLWYISGFVSTVYWMTKEKDIVLDDLLSILIVSMAGPLMIIVGIFHFADDTKVIFRKRK